MEEYLTFDDVLIKPAFSAVGPEDIDISVSLAPSLKLNIPFLSAAMDTVTEAAMAIAMAQMGGLGVLHRNMQADLQAGQVELVKRFVADIVTDPLVIGPHETLQTALEKMGEHDISALPVVDDKGKLIGILTHRDVRFAHDVDRPVSEYMSKDHLVTVKADITREEAKRLLHQHRIEKLLVVDDLFQCKGIITVKDIEKARKNPLSCTDGQGHLCVAAAISPDERDFQRAMVLKEAGVDVLVIDTAHGHSAYAMNVLKRLKEEKAAAGGVFPLIVAGNIATKEAARDLIEAGADILKVGIGPGSICTTRVVAGVGVPQLSAVMEVCQEAKGTGVSVIADGGIRQAGDVAKALAAGANAVMMGSFFAGTDESPGPVYTQKGRSYKAYRGMGSLGAMMAGSASRYFQDEKGGAEKLVPEGVEGQVPRKGPVRKILYQLSGAVKACMRYTGACTVSQLQACAQFIRISQASYREGQVHDVELTRETD